MASEVDICNRALQKLGASRITSLLDNSASARACNLAYEHVRDAELRAHGWNFAVKRTQLASDATAPEYGYSYAYTLPPDCLRLLTNDPAEAYYATDWKVEGRKILSNDTAPLSIRYIHRVTDPNEYDSLFIEMLSSSLAMEMCEELTQSNTKYQLIAASYKESLREARRINAFENPSPEQQTDPWINVRL